MLKKISINNFVLLDINSIVVYQLELWMSEHANMLDYRNHQTQTSKTK